MMGVKMRERVAIDHGSVFHGALHIDHKCEGRDSFKKEARRLELKTNHSKCVPVREEVLFFWNFAASAQTNLALNS